MNLNMSTDSDSRLYNRMQTIGIGNACTRAYEQQQQHIICFKKVFFQSVINIVHRKLGLTEESINVYCRYEYTYTETVV